MSKTAPDFSDYWLRFFAKSQPFTNQGKSFEIEISNFELLCNATGSMWEFAYRHSPFFNPEKGYSVKIVCDGSIYQIEMTPNNNVKPIFIEGALTHLRRKTLSNKNTPLREMAIGALDTVKKIVSMEFTGTSVKMPAGTIYRVNARDKVDLIRPKL